MAEPKPERELYDWSKILPGFDPGAEARYDVMALGALVHRVDAGKQLWAKTRNVQIHAETGAEFNLVANCQAFGLKGAMLTGLADYAIGEMIEREIRGSGVNLLAPVFEHGPWKAHHSAVYSSRPGPNVPNEVDYNRSDEAALLIKQGMFNYKRIFEGGVKWVHTGGLYEALGEHAPDVMIEYLKAGKKQGAIASLDLNFRDKLVKADRRIKVVRGQEFLNMDVFEAEYGQPPPEIDAILAAYINRTKDVVKEAHVLFANESDIADCLGIEGNKGRTIDVDITKSQQREVMDAYENLKIVVTSLRREHDNMEHEWGAVATVRLENGEYLQVNSPIEKMHVEDRIGGGDGNAGGFVRSIFDSYSPQEAVINGVVSGKMVASLRDDNASGAKWRWVTDAGKKVAR